MGYLYFGTNSGQVGIVKGVASVNFETAGFLNLTMENEEGSASKPHLFLHANNLLWATMDEKAAQLHVSHTTWFRGEYYTGLPSFSERAPR